MDQASYGQGSPVPAPIQLFPSSPSIQSQPTQASYMPAQTSPVYFNPSTAAFYPGQQQQLPQQHQMPPQVIYSETTTTYAGGVQQQHVPQQAAYPGTMGSMPTHLPQVSQPSFVMSEISLENKNDYEPADDDMSAVTHADQAFGLHFNFEKRQIDIMSWFSRGWGLYKENWAYYSLFALLFVAVDWMSGLVEADDPHETMVWAGIATGVSGLIWPLQLGYFVAGAHIVRHRVGSAPHVHIPFATANLFRPFFLYFPLLALTLIMGFAVGIGLLLLVIPGLYLMVTLGMAPYLYLENHHSVNYFDPLATSTFGVIDALLLSRRIVHTYFWKFLGFLILAALLNFFASFLIVLPLVTLPVTNLALVFAYHDMIGLMPHRGLDDHCFCC